MVLDPTNKGASKSFGSESVQQNRSKSPHKISQIRENQQNRSKSPSHIRENTPNLEFLDRTGISPKSEEDYKNFFEAPSPHVITKGSSQRNIEIHIKTDPSGTPTKADIKVKPVESESMNEAEEKEVGIKMTPPGKTNLEPSEKDRLVKKIMNPPKLSVEERKVLRKKIEEEFNSVEVSHSTILNNNLENPHFLRAFLTYPEQNQVEKERYGEYYKFIKEIRVLKLLCNEREEIEKKIFSFDRKQIDEKIKQQYLFIIDNFIKDEGADSVNPVMCPSGKDSPFVYLVEKTWTHFQTDKPFKEIISIFDSLRGSAVKFFTNYPGAEKFTKDSDELKFVLNQIYKE